MAAQKTLLTALLATSAAAIAVGAVLQGRGVSPRPEPPAVALDPQGEPAAKPPSRTSPRIDVVFLLDTTGSMGGLLEGAKQKIWSIADRIVSGDPRPDVRVGLVAYRDRGDDYVTRLTPLTRDMDAVQEALFALSPGGGGDHPEDVNAALTAALREQPWDDGERVLRLLFVVGDAPPHDDYDGEKSWELARQAKEKGILVNTLRCGTDRGAAEAFARIAASGGGQFDSIAQDGGVQVAATPHDAELAELNRELAGTVVAYGTAAERRRSAKKMASRSGLLPAASAAAAAYAAKSGRMNDEDLLTQIEEGAVRADSLKEEALPEELQGLDAATRNARIEETKKKRAQIQQRILEVSKKRDAYVEQQKAEGKDKSELDDRIFSTLKRQAKAIDVTY